MKEVLLELDGITVAEAREAAFHFLEATKHPKEKGSRGLYAPTSSAVLPTLVRTNKK